MFSLHSDLARAIVVADVLLQYSVLSELPVPYSIIHRHVATQFS